jgi:arylsulfatase A-like enzyme
MDAPLVLRPQRRPNVLWIFGDQHRAQATSYRRDPNVFTPNIDNLVREGTSFDCAVAGAPWCTPFRGALLSGLYPHQSGVIGNGHALSPSIPTIANAYNDAGYHTAYVGKWHVDGTNDRDHYVPPDRRGGFHYWMGNDAANNQHEHYVFGTESEEPVRLDGYETDALSDLLLNHLRAHVGGAEDYQPFFAALSVQPPHGPTVTPTNPSYGARHRHPGEIELRRNVPVTPWIEAQARFALSGYYGAIENLDFNVGRIRQALIDLGIDRDTYVVFFSDHGDMMGSHGQFGKSAPWEESIRIPFVVQRGGGAYNMRVGRSDAVMNHVDIAPTSLGLCGIAAPAAMAGHDYSAHCLSVDAPEYVGPPRPELEPQSAFLQQIPPKRMSHTVNTPWRGVATRDGWKYVCTPGNDWQLFNVAEDPFEQANYIFDEAYRPQRERCHQLLAEWIAATGDDFTLPDLAPVG